MTFLLLKILSKTFFFDNPLVTDGPEIRFYAGAPIVMPSGNKLGTLCIISDKPREFNQAQSALLQDLAKIVINELVSQQAATQDALTGINNRRGFNILATKTIANSARYGWKSSLVYLDLNKFKAINDIYGHKTGDKILTDFAELLCRIVRDSDILARLGGDEFVVMFMGTDLQAAHNKIDTLLKSIEKYNLEAAQPYVLKVSYGVVEYDPDKHINLEELLSSADNLMYENKLKSR